MSFEKAREQADKMNSSSTEKKNALVIIETLESLSQSIMEAKSTIQGAALDLNAHLTQLKNPADGVSQNLFFLKHEVSKLNTLLARLDSTTTDLGKKANRLAFWLVLLTGVLAIPILWEYLPKIFELILKGFNLLQMFFNSSS